ncbi:MAG TPA: helix-turn-helix domain-containing protein [Nocardioides sp.]|nr:helix-turn-helix domain-containing protein [Nocardioides sp.]
MSPDERRKAIVQAMLPLLVERGDEVTTRQIAEAAGIAEGTIFRVFPDKKALMLAAAEEAINPADGAAAWEQAMAEIGPLRDKVVVAAQRVLDRMLLTMTVMFAVRRHLGSHEELHRHDKKHFGPPQFVIDAQAELHRRLTGIFEAHRDELAVDPEVAAVALRSLIFGASRPELGMTPALTAEQIADLLLSGVMTRGEK